RCLAPAYCFSDNNENAFNRPLISNMTQDRTVSTAACMKEPEPPQSDTTKLPTRNEKMRKSTWMTEGSDNPSISHKWLFVRIHSGLRHSLSKSTLLFGRDTDHIMLPLKGKRMILLTSEAVTHKRKYLYSG